jgi:hypothetical protein
MKDRGHKMADKFHSDIHENVETIIYLPWYKDTADLEGATKTITATAEASSGANATYSGALILSKPTDTRLVVKMLATRLQVTIDSMTAGHLYCRVYVDQQDADHRLFDEDFSPAGDKIDAVTVHSNNKTTIFNLLRDGTAHTFYFFFWVNSGNAVLSLCRLWEGVGQNGTSGAAVVSVLHQGFIGLSLTAERIGTGSVNALRLTFSGDNHSQLSASGGSTNSIAGTILADNPDIYLRGDVATDAVFVTYLLFTIRKVD